ncbi:MAG: hypothetical protein K1X79_07255 [Oligoflexia bacterium]|nr:hypothetical protein [Oligoflexia bacterium]
MSALTPSDDFDSGSVDSRWVQETLGYLDLDLPGRFHSTTWAVNAHGFYRGDPRADHFDLSGVKLRIPQGFAPLIDPTTHSLAIVARQLPLLVDADGREHVLVGNRTLVRFRDIPESDPVRAKVWLMRELLDEFFRLAEEGVDRLNDRDLAARRTAFRDEANPELKSARAALLAGALAGYIERSLEKLEQSRQGQEETEVTRVFLGLVDQAWSELSELLPYLRLRGGPRGAILDVDGLLAAEAPEAMKAAMAGSDFTLLGIYQKRADTKLEIQVVGRIMREIIRAPEWVGLEGAKFAAARDQLERKVANFVNAALLRLESDRRDGFSEYDNAFVGYRVAHRDLITLLRPEEFDPSLVAVSHLNAGLDLIHGMVFLRRAMPIRVSAFLAIAATARLSRAIVGMSGAAGLNNPGLAMAASDYYARFEALIREKFRDGVKNGAKELAIANFHAAAERLAGALEAVGNASVVSWVSSVDSAVKEWASQVDQFTATRPGRVLAERKQMLLKLRGLMDGLASLGL